MSSCTDILGSPGWLPSAVPALGTRPRGPGSGQGAGQPQEHVAALRWDQPASPKPMEFFSVESVGGPELGLWGLLPSGGWAACPVLGAGIAGPAGPGLGYAGSLEADVWCSCSAGLGFCTWSSFPPAVGLVWNLLCSAILWANGGHGVTANVSAGGGVGCRGDMS